MVEKGVIKYSGALIQLIYQGGGKMILPDEEILSLECIVAGTTYIQNLDEIAKKIEIGQFLDLKREQENEYDNFAISIYNSQGDKLGYIPRDKNETIARLMDAGKWFYAKVYNKKWKGNWLKIELEVFLKE